MEDKYKVLVTEIIKTYLEDTLDTDLYNVDGIVSLATKEYLETYKFDEFADEVEESLRELVYQTFKIQVDL